MAVIGLPKEGNHWPDVPFEYFDINSEQTIPVNEEGDYYTIFNSWPDHHFEFSLDLCHPKYFLDKALMDVVNRKIYCDRHPAVSPFPGSFDDLPDWWVQAEMIIDDGIIKAQKYKANHG